MNRGKFLIAAGLCTVLMGMSGTKVYAGGINSEEARVISYYSGTFSYNGKTYVATESAKGSAYSKLAQDGVDLTASEADELILELSVNVQAGVEEGYLVPVGGTAEEEPAAQTEAGTVTEQVKESENPDNKKDENTQNPDDSIRASEKIDENNGEAEQGSASKSGKSEEIASGTEGGQSSETDGLHAGGDNDRAERSNKKKVDKAQIIKDTKKKEKQGGKEAVVVYDSKGENIQSEALSERLEEGPVTILDYTEGTMQTIDKDSSLLHEARLPIRNTGYLADFWYLVPLVILGGFLLIAVFCFIRPKKDIPWLISAGLFTAILTVAVAVGGRDTIRAYTAEWKSVWIACAPEYIYQEGAANTADRSETGSKAVLHDQYGSIRCGNIELSAPLYYGDSDEDLEKGAGIYPASSLPGEAGTTLIAGHDSTYFAPLKNISIGDVIELDCVDGTHDYRVVGTKVAKASDESAYKFQDEKDELILYTCYPFGVSQTQRDERFFVYAVEINAEGNE